MLPKAIEDLIWQYLEEIERASNLPKKGAIRRLVQKSNDYILRCLGFVLDLPTADIMRVRYRITMDSNFIFYFRLSPIQRLQLIAIIERGMCIDPPTSKLCWLFVTNKPRLISIPRYRDIFVSSLMCILLSRLRSLHSIF